MGLNVGPSVVTGSLVVDDSGMDVDSFILLSLRLI